MVGFGVEMGNGGKWYNVVMTWVLDDLGNPVLRGCSLVVIGVAWWLLVRNGCVVW